jgi:hypothetical protein
VLKLTGDEWGRDPQVRYLRTVFAKMEKAQGELLLHLHVSPFDYRLRRVREATLKSFEKAWRLATHRDIANNEEEIAALYAHCLAHCLTINRIHVPPDLLPVNEGIAGILREVFT